MADKQYRLGVVGVFINDVQEILVCERSNVPGSWQFPQGGIDAGETPAQTILREVREELGTNAFEVKRQAEGLTCYDFPPGASFKLAKKIPGTETSIGFYCNSPTVRGQT